MNARGFGIGRIGMLAAVIALASALPTGGTSSTDHTMSLQRTSASPPDQLGLKLVPERGVMPVAPVVLARLVRAESVKLVAVLSYDPLDAMAPLHAVLHSIARANAAATIYQPPSARYRLTNVNTLNAMRPLRPVGTVRWFSNPTPGRSTTRYG